MRAIMNLRLYSIIGERGVLRRRLAESLRSESRCNIKSTSFPRRDLDDHNPYSNRNVMKRTILLCGILGGVLVSILRWSEYQFLVVDHSVEIYAALVAATFSGLGIWLGLRLTRPRQPEAVSAVSAVPSPAPPQFSTDEQKRESLGITRRELEILGLVAEGMSNREIAEKLFVSENTIKTHCSRTFDKLGARRRTEAVQLGKRFGLLP